MSATRVSARYSLTSGYGTYGRGTQRMPGITGLTGGSRTSARNYTGSSSGYGTSTAQSRVQRSSSLPRNSTPVRSTKPPLGTTTESSSRSTSRSLAPITGHGRPLPPGPGPLDYTGRKMSPLGNTSKNEFKVKSGSYTSSIASNGPLKPDYSTSYNYGSSFKSSGERNGGATTSNYTASTLPRTNSSLSRRRSSSISNLTEKTSNLKLDDDILTTGRSRHSEENGSSSRLSKRETYDNDRSNHYESGRDSGRAYTESKDSDDFFTKTFNSRLPSSSPGQEKDPGRPPNGLSYKDKYYDPTHSTKGSRQSPTHSVSVSSRYSNGGKAGLRNLGNTCFMNSVLQCLSNTRPLLNFCLNDEYVSEKNTSTSSMKGLLMSAYSTLMSSLWKSRDESSWKSRDESYINPSSFKTQIQRFAPRFMGYSQQDAQEFLRYLLEGLHEDVNRVRSKPKPVTIKDEEFSNDADKAQEYWRVYLSYDNSKIVEIFVGQLKSELRFKDCGHKSTTFDPFWDLSVPIPKRGSEVSLQQCISLFMREEELDHDERPTCEICKKRKSCTKSFSIQKFPQILVFHLKRFSQGRYSQKVSTCVDFQSTLDMSEYSAEKGGPRVVYNLYAVSNHIGSVYSGHYTAYCKHPFSDEWNTFNDTRVSSISSSQVISSEAYLVFYELASQKNARL